MQSSRVGVLDLELGNVASVVSALNAVGLEPERVKCEKDVSRFKSLIFPGVGSFAKASAELTSEMKMVLKEYALNPTTKLVGICLGMQLLFEKGYEGAAEDRGSDGLGILAGNVRPLRHNFKVATNMGWSKLHLADQKKQNIAIDGRFYFVHKFYCDCADEYIIFRDKHGIPAIVKKNGVIGMQFHPERSGRFGVRLLSNIFGEGTWAREL